MNKVDKARALKAYLDHEDQVSAVPADTPIGISMKLWRVEIPATATVHVFTRFAQLPVAVRNGRKRSQTLAVFSMPGKQVTIMSDGSVRSTRLSRLAPPPPSSSRGRR